MNVYCCCCCLFFFSSDLNVTAFFSSSHQSTPIKVERNATGEKDVIRPVKRRKLVSASAIIGFDCDLCAKIFVTKRNLNLHKKRHLNKPKIECEICGKQYASKCALNEHLIRHNPHEYIRYRCDQPKCNGKFYYKWRYDAHKKLQHFKNPDNFRCEFCNRSLATTFSLSRHLKKCPENKYQLENRHTF